MSFVKTLRFISIVYLVLNLAFYFFNFSKIWKGGDRLMYLTQMPWTHNVHIHSLLRFLHSFSLMHPFRLQHKRPSPLLSWMQCWTMASSLEAGRLEWNEIWLANVQSSSTSTHLGIHLCQINWVHSSSCLCWAQTVIDAPIVQGLFLWISV